MWHAIIIYISIFKIVNVLFTSTKKRTSKSTHFFHKINSKYLIVSYRCSPTYNLAQHLTKLLHPLVGKTPHHVPNSAGFVNTVKGIILQHSNVLMSFDIKSLFTNVPTDEAILMTKSMTRTWQHTPKTNQRNATSNHWSTFNLREVHILSMERDLLSAVFRHSNGIPDIPGPS